MNEHMCIRGYGAALRQLQPYIDMGKVIAYLNHAAGIVFECSLAPGEEFDQMLCRMEVLMCEQGASDGLGLLDSADSTWVCEFVANNYGQWFLVMPSCMPWEHDITTMPHSIEEAEQVLLRAVRPFLVDDADEAAIRSLLNYIDDIS